MVSNALIGKYVHCNCSKVTLYRLLSVLHVVGKTFRSLITALCYCTGESNLSGVFDEVRPVSSKWYQLCNCLGILASDLDAINTTKNGDCDRCLNEGLKEWLRRNYNTEEHGSPTWRKLVAAVDNSAGGNNHVLALTIAKKHKGELFRFGNFGDCCKTRM